MSLRGARIVGQPYPNCKYCGEWIDRPNGSPWTHYFSQKQTCYLANTMAEPGAMRQGRHSVIVNVPGSNQ
jgi:hypothetical protein